ncbi:hypothetical protein V2J09_005360 [Rumex salicifolius]
MGSKKSALGIRFWGTKNQSVIVQCVIKRRSRYKMAPAFKIILQYSGYFEGDLELEYKEGFETNLEVSDVDYLCYFDLIDMIREANPILKGMMIIDEYYCIPGMSMSEGLKTIKLDNDVMEMAVHELTSKVNSPKEGKN